MRYPISTGEAARLLNVTEPKLAETVRRGKVVPPPPLMAGRRLWGREHLVQAARALRLLDDALLGVLEKDGQGCSEGRHV